MKHQIRLLGPLTGYTSESDLRDSAGTEIDASKREFFFGSRMFLAGSDPFKLGRIDQGSCFLIGVVDKCHLQHIDSVIVPK